MLFAGAEGLEKGLELDKPVTEIIVDNKQYDTLPLSLIEAIEIAEKSDFINKVIPAKHLEQFIDYKKNEYKQYATCADKSSFLDEKYFGRI